MWLITHSCQQALCCLQQNASPECTQQLLSSGCARHQYCTSTVQASVSALIVGVEHWNVKYRRLLRITEDGRDCRGLSQYRQVPSGLFTERLSSLHLCYMSKQSCLLLLKSLSKCRRFGIPLRANHGINNSCCKCYSVPHGDSPCLSSHPMYQV